MQADFSFLGMSSADWAISLAVFLLAGFVKGVIGLGLPTVAVGLLSLVMSPVQAAALLIVPSMVTNVWQLLAGGAFMALARRLWSMLAGIVLGTLAGHGWMSADSGQGASMALGVALVLYALAGLASFKWSVTPVQERWCSPLAGLLTGLVTAATGVFVIPAVPYLQALDLEREQMIQALGLSFTLSTMALALNLGQAGLLGSGVAGASLVVLLPALLGMGVGGWLRGRIPAPVFRRCFFVGLLLLGRASLPARELAAMIACTPRRWIIDGPHLLSSDQFHVVALEQGCMIGMIDGQLSENHVVVNMIYVSPPWRGSLVLRDMLAALKLTCRHVVVPARQHGGRLRRHDAMRK